MFHRCMMFANDLVFSGERSVELVERLEKWSKALEGQWLMISKSEMEEIVFDLKGNAD